PPGRASPALSPTPAIKAPGNGTARTTPQAPAHLIAPAPAALHTPTAGAPKRTGRQLHQLRRSGRDRRRGGRLGRLQRQRQHLANVPNRVHVELAEHLGGHIVQGGLVALRGPHGGGAGPVRGPQLLLKPADPPPP